jgi:hypothetical protein
LSLFIFHPILKGDFDTVISGNCRRMSMEKLKLLPPEIHSMVEKGQLSALKIDALLRLKEIVKRFSSENRISDSEAVLLQERYGEKPGMITWPEYFLAETASRYFELSDTDFNRIVDTVRFDLISSHRIFVNKPESFMSEIELQGLDVWSKESTGWTEEEKEHAHLYVLLGYFKEMKLGNIRLSRIDEEWFNEFVEKDNSIAV